MKLVQPRYFRATIRTVRTVRINPTSDALQNNLIAFLECVIPERTRHGEDPRFCVRRLLAQVTQ